MKIQYLALLFLLGCGGQMTVPESPTPPKTNINKPIRPNPPDKSSFCTYTIDNVCIIVEDRFLDVDSQSISQMLEWFQYETDFRFWGFSLSDLALSTEVKIDFRKANTNTTEIGSYDDATATARVNLRHGDRITNEIDCMDKYYIAGHELLHWVADRYLHSTYPDDNVHNVQYVFKQWAELNSLPTDYTIEGRLYTLTWRLCQSE